MGSSTNWIRLSAADLKTFDDNQRKIVLTAMERGGLGRISSKGHALIRNKDGAQFTVSSNSNRMGMVRATSQLNRYFPVEPMELPTVTLDGLDSNGHQPPGHQPPPDFEENLAEALGTEPRFECPALDCDRSFATLQGLRMHNTRTHLKKGVQAGDKKASKEEPTPVVETPVPETPAPDEADLMEKLIAEQSAKLQAIHKILGEDERIGKLEAEVAGLREEVRDLRTERDELQAKLDLVKEAFGA